MNDCTMAMPTNVPMANLPPIAEHVMSMKQSLKIGKENHSKKSMIESNITIT